MITEKLLIDGENDEISINRSAEILCNGGIVAIPTETVYGLAASAYDENAIKKVFEAKGRPQDNPLIVHISDMEMLFDVAFDIPEIALKCAKEFWPGPFTMILKRTDKTARCVSAGLDTVAVRMPSQKTAHDIIEKSRLPLAAPSANISGSPSPTTALHVERDLDGKIDAIVYGEDCEVGVESTVVSFCTNPPRLLRPGAVTFEQLLRFIPDLAVDKAVFKEPEKNAKVASPGMKYKHYAPKTKTYLVDGSSYSFAKYVNDKKDAVAVCFNEEKDSISIPTLVYGKMNDSLSLAHNVFSVLREIDKMDVSEAYIHSPDKNGVGLAVYNRLVRAAAFKEVHLKNIIGLTGPTGAGKSSLNEIFKSHGYCVIDCDTVARQAVETGSEGLKSLVAAFGDGILNSDNSLNRKALAKIAFSSKDKTELLNKTILPHISELIFDMIKDKEKVVLDAPTLFESGLNSICDITVSVLAEKSSRINRIMARDNIGKADAVLRADAGKTDDFYIKNSDFVFYNNGSFDELLCNFNNELSNIL